MKQTSSIEIDFDVHRAIELERRGFNDTPNAVLRRKFGLDFVQGARQASSPNKTMAKERHSPRERVGWTRDGLFLSAGTQLKFEYNDVERMGRVVTDYLEIEGKKFKAPSAAVIEFCRTKDGRRTHLNGWRMIQARVGSESTWHSLDALRDAQRNDPRLKTIRDKMIDDLAKELGLE